MRVLQVNKYNYSRGGADKYFLDISKRLEEAGHEVAVFSMHHPKNNESNYSDYFVSRISFNENLGWKNTCKIFPRVMYSLEAKRKFKKLVNDFQPDVIHLHNIYHQISPSILSVAKKRNIPVVMHLHDYKLICPSHTLFTKNKHCERCKGYKYHNCIKYRCLKNSFWASSLVALEMYFHHRILKIYKKKVDIFITPSRYMKEACVRFSFPDEQFRVVYNPYSSELFQDEPYVDNSNNSFLYFGRISQEKGLKTLIKAFENSNESLQIVGEGDIEKELKDLAQKLNVKVDFLGFKKGDELRSIIKKAKAIIIPSIWAENMPLSMLEAMSLRKVVIASTVGGLPEMVKHKFSGFLFEAGNVNDLKEKIKELNKYNLEAIANEAYNLVKDLSPENNLREVLSVYSEVIERKNHK